MSALLDGHGDLWETATMLLYVGLSIIAVNVLAVVVVARLGRRLSRATHEQRQAAVPREKRSVPARMPGYAGSLHGTALRRRDRPPVPSASARNS
jgi:hypothetical protein